MSQINGLITLGSAKNIDDFICLCKIIRDAEVFLKEPSFFLDIRDIIMKLPANYESMPVDPIDLNFYFTLCEFFSIDNVDHLENYKRAVLDRKQEMAFEYLKRGIFFSPGSRFVEVIREHLNEETAERFINMNNHYSFLSPTCSLARLSACHVLEDFFQDVQLCFKSLVNKFMSINSREKTSSLDAEKRKKLDVIISHIYMLSRHQTVNISEFTKKASLDQSMRSVFEKNSTETKFKPVSHPVQSIFSDSRPNFPEIFKYFKGRQENKPEQKTITFYLSFDKNFYEIKADETLFKAYKAENPYSNKVTIQGYNDCYAVVWMLFLLFEKDYAKFFFCYSFSELHHLLACTEKFLGQDEADNLALKVYDSVKFLNRSSVIPPQWFDNSYVKIDTRKQKDIYDFYEF